MRGTGAQFMLSEALAKPLKPSYKRGNMQTTMAYLANGLKIGLYQVRLKRNFDTACWIPPVGSRAAHSIYYGDRMLDRVLDFFAKSNEIEVPDQDALKALAASAKLTRINAERVKRGLPEIGLGELGPISATEVFDTKVDWFQEHLSTPLWDALQEKLVMAVASYGRHEREHARNTSQDLKQVSRDLRLMGISFQWFNLFEDARIEHRSRQEQGEPFGWKEFEDIASTDSPFSLFLRAIQLEGSPDEQALESEEPFGLTKTLSVGAAADRIQDYYLRAVACPTDKHLYPIIQEFLAEFKDEMPAPPPGSEKGEKGEGESGSGGGAHEGEDGGTGADAKTRAGDLSTAAEAAEKGDDFLELFDEDSEVIGGTDEQGRAAEAAADEKLKGKTSKDGKGVPGGQGKPGSADPLATGGAGEPQHFLAREPGKIDAAYQTRVEKLTDRLLQMFKVKSLNVPLESPGKRMSGRHLARGELRYPRPVLFGGKGKRKYTIVYDCSGSMTGRTDREGKLFLLAMNNLAKLGYLQGNLILSGWVAGKPAWLTYPFPVEQDVLLAIHPSHSSEGIQAALQDNLRDIKGSDDVFIYTDACICDAPLNRDFFAGHRIWPVGLYVGSEKNASEMEKHFPQNIIRNTIEEVVEKMLTRNRRTVG